jgi:hypothetical protein
VKATLSPDQLRTRLRIVTALLIVGLVLSGLTAIPILTQFDLGARWLGADFRAGGWMPGFVAEWLTTAHRGVLGADAAAPFIWYGTDWLAFGHVVIALSFVGAWRDPVANRWLFQFGMLACVAVLPWALIFGAVRGIPLWWRAVDCSFGILGFLPCWLGHRWALALQATQRS